MNTGKPANTVTGDQYPPYPTQVSEHQTQHTQATGMGSHGPSPCNTQISGRPNTSRQRHTPTNTSHSEIQNHKHPIASCLGSHRGNRSRWKGQPVCTCTPAPHIPQHESMCPCHRMGIRVCQSVCTPGRGGDWEEREVLAPCPWKNGGSNKHRACNRLWGTPDDCPCPFKGGRTSLRATAGASPMPRAADPRLSHGKSGVPRMVGGSQELGLGRGGRLPQ